MTDAAPPASKAADKGFSSWLTPVRIALIVWAAMSLIAIVARWHAIATLELSDTDDAMRMAQVRDRRHQPLLALHQLLLVQLER